ncbi:unnamed protein product [Paramecium primaurelia]|uniref:Transmembrane protein n=1 Tax=Paramecium primaurelia TaxID=5886 RepID=A0A8S1JXC5_PARPR|nr:unnamed protein product [Paramecium primaurelia]
MSYYDFSIDIDEYDQDQINLIIQQIFKIKSKGGGGLISASSFSCFNCSFEDIIGLKSSVFEIKTQGDGNISFINLTIKSLEYDLSQIVDSTGCITIYSSNSLLNLQIYNAVFQNIFNRMAPSIFTIIPSLQKNQVRIEDIQIINTISLKNPIINLQFSSYDINLNTVIIRNIKISQYEDIWIKYFDKTGMISQSEIQDLTGTSNAMIQLSNCKVVIQNILIQGLYACPLIKLINVQYLFISYFQAIEIQTFYGFSLLELKLNLQIKQSIYFEFVYIYHFKPYIVRDASIFYNPKINYMISGCGQVENIQQNPQIYYFNDLINLMQTWQLSSIIEIQTDSNQTVIYLQNILLQDNLCQDCSNGLLFLKMINHSTLIIRDLICNENSIQKYGCINIWKSNGKDQYSIISNSIFFHNNGSTGTGVALYSSNMQMKINQCKILKNRASFQGGGLYLDMKNTNLMIKESTIIYNQALEGGGIFMLNNGNINQNNFIQSFLHFNLADYFANNLVEFPTHLSLVINSQEMQSEELRINNITLRSLKLKPYIIIEQGIKKISSYLMVPSNQVVKDYQFFSSGKQKYIFKEFSISIKNSRNEFLFNIQQYSCQISYKTAQLNQQYQLKDFKRISTLQADIRYNNFDLGTISFHFNPYQEENEYLLILISCSQQNSTEYLHYLIKARSYKCQLGEFYADEGCQICESIYGFYSVTYNATKCSVFDKTKFANITSHAIQLLVGYWRPNLYSDYTEFCFKNFEFCRGGWQVGNELCSIGHIGGLCEECDNHNIRGQGQFFKNQQDSICYGCSDTANYIVSFIFASLWALISIIITLRSIQKSNQLFTTLKLKLKPKYSKILFKLDQDLESIFIKILLNYLWIFSVIFTFNLKFSLSFSNIDQFSNTSQFMAFSLDCYLSGASQIELLYLRIITTLGILLIQFIIITVGLKVYQLFIKQKFDKSIISNTLLYLYVSNYAGLIKQFCSILSKRIISNNQYIQGDLTLIFGSQNHYQWIYYFAIPGLGIFGCCIPFSLFFLMLINKKKLEYIKLRRHICYLFNEYNEQSYFWEQIKLSKKTVIILIMTYFESNILLKASLLGLVLLVYQLLAGKQQPYIISSLNKLDLQTGQICSIAIFVATTKYVSEKEIENSYSEILQVVIMLLCLRLCYPFFLDIFRVYIKKYQVKIITFLFNIQKFINPNSRMANYLDNILKKWRLKENRLRTNFSILKLHLLTISKAQIKNQKSHLTITENQNILSSGRHKQQETVSNNFLLQLE